VVDPAIPIWPLQFLPKIEQVPVEQVPVGQAESEADDGPEAQKRDNCFTGCGAPHLGQFDATSLDDLAKCSN
jgi:hypothetical protein